MREFCIVTFIVLTLASFAIATGAPSIWEPCCLHHTRGVIK